jgi:hypothetical protein
MDAMPPPADAETPAEVPVSRSVMLDASGERFVATLLKVCHGTAFCAHTFVPRPSAALS